MKLFLALILIVCTAQAQQHPPEVQAGPDTYEETGHAPRPEYIATTNNKRRLRVGLSNKFKFELDLDKYGRRVTYALDALSPKNQARFLAFREWAMISVSALLTGTYLVTGTSMMIKDTIYFVGKKSEPLHEFWVENMQRPTQQNLVSVMREEAWAATPLDWTTPEGSYRARVYEFYRKTLSALDRSLVASLRIKGAGLEFATVPTIGATAGAGKENKMGGGISIPGYLTIGFNWQENAVLARIHASREKTEGGVSFGFGVGFRLGGYLDILEEAKNDSAIVEGRTYNPPGPQNVVKYADRASLYIGVGALTAFNAIGTYLAGASALAMITSTVAVAGWEWGMFSYGSSTRADILDIKLYANKKPTKEVRPGYAVAKGVLNELRERGAKEGPPMVRAAARNIAVGLKDPNAILAKYRNRPYFPKSCSVALDAKFMYGKSE